MGPEVADQRPYVLRCVRTPPPANFSIELLELLCQQWKDGLTCIREARQTTHKREDCVLTECQATPKLTPQATLKLTPS